MKFKRILVVDDSNTSRLIIKRCFEIAGYAEAQFLEAGDGAEALGILDKEPVDLIVSDLKMPRMDGRTFVRKLGVRNLTRNIPVIIVSSIASNAEVEKGFDGLVLAIIQKPISPEKLITALDTDIA